MCLFLYPFFVSENSQISIMKSVVEFHVIYFWVLLLLLVRVSLTLHDDQIEFYSNVSYKGLSTKQ